MNRSLVFACLVAVLSSAATAAPSFNVATLMVMPEFDNKAALFGPDGSLVGRYRKSHFGRDEEKLFDRSQELPVFDTPLGRMGILICFDRRPPDDLDPAKLGDRAIRERHPHLYRRLVEPAPSPKP